MTWGRSVLHLEAGEAAVTFRHLHRRLMQPMICRLSTATMSPRPRQQRRSASTSILRSLQCRTCRQHRSCRRQPVPSASDSEKAPCQPALWKIHAGAMSQHGWRQWSEKLLAVLRHRQISPQCMSAPQQAQTQPREPAGPVSRDQPLLHMWMHKMSCVPNIKGSDRPPMCVT